MFCREQVARLNQYKEQINALGAEVYAIGNGTVAMAKDFAEQFEVSFELYTDPGRKTYKALSFGRAFGLGMSSFGKARRAMKSGHKQGAVKGDPWQQGGEAIIKDGAILWSHYSKQAGAHLEPEALLEQVKKYLGG